MQKLVPEERLFQQNFLEKFHNIRRIFNNKRRVEPDYRNYYHTGFAFKNLPKDETFIPKQFDTDQELFTFYYDKLIKSGEIKVYIREMQSYFEVNGRLKAGCIINDRRREVRPPPPRLDDDLEKSYISRKIVPILHVTGNSVVAKQLIREGELIIKEKPQVLCRSPCCRCSGNYYFECNHCAMTVDRYLSCPDCNLAIYCSHKCMMEAYSQYHAIECKAFRLHFFGNTDMAWVAFRMLLSGGYSKTSPAYKLENLHIIGVLRKTMLIVTYLIMYTDFFRNANSQACFPEGISDYEKYVMIGGLMISYIKQACTATFYFPDERFSLHTYTNGGRFETPGLCKRLLTFQHRCKPNAVIIFDTDKYYVKTVRDIPANGEITVNYTHLDEEFYGFSYKFKCRCARCTDKNKYIGKYYKCFKCSYPKGQKMEHYPPKWKCVDCFTFDDNDILDAKVDQLDKIFTEIILMDARNYKPMLSMLLLFLDIYDTVYPQIYPEHFFVCQKIAIHSIENSDTEIIGNYVMSLIEALSCFLNKFSFQRLETLISIVCTIQKKLIKNETKGIRTLLQVQKYAMSIIKFLCNFYMLVPEYKEFEELINSISDAI